MAPNLWKWLFAFLGLLAVATGQSLGTDPSDAEAFETIFQQLGGDNWYLSINYTNPCGWTKYKRKIVCDDIGKITEIELYGNNLQGTIPTEFALLTSLTYLSLRKNELTGTIPSELQELTLLKTLYLFDTKLSGTIPTAVANNLLSLTDIRLYNAQLEQPIPFFLSANIKTLWLLPNPICPLADYELYAPDTDFITSDCACSLFPCKNGGLCSSVNGGLGASDFSCDCSATGFFGTTCEDESPDKASLLSLYNALDGENWRWKPDFTLPICTQSWRVMCNGNGRVVELHLHKNNLRGTLPASLGLSFLTLLDLSGNDLVGTIPTSLASYALTSLNFANNFLYGSIPTNFGTTTSLQALFLNGNQLSGSIPTQFVALTNIHHLDLSDNILVGTLPLSTMTNLKILSLQNNRLTGTLPSYIGSFTSLISLNLKNNLFNGVLPTEIGSLSNLVSLRLSQNSFEGTIPTEYSGTGRYQELELGENSLCPLVDYSSWSSAVSDFVNTECDHCLSSPCQNLGTCKNVRTGFICHCPSGKRGTTCTDDDPCSTSPCQNGGSCVYSGASGFICGCTPSYSGETCGVENFCFSQPCQHGGTCFSGSSSYNCSCFGGDSGTNCQTRDYCFSEPCQNGGICSSGASSYTCNCASTQHHGTNCEFVDSCTPNPCENGGTCANDDDGFSCTCPEFYAGKVCQNVVLSNFAETLRADGALLAFRFDVLPLVSYVGDRELVGASGQRSFVADTPLISENSNKALNVTSLPAGFQLNQTFSVAGSAITIEMAFYISSMVESEWLLVGNSTDFSSTEAHFKLEVHEEGQFSLVSGTTTIFRSDPSVLQLGTLHHLIVSRNSTILRVNLDGVQLVEDAVGNRFPFLNAPGLDVVVCPNCFGSWDELAFYGSLFDQVDAHSHDYQFHHSP